MKLLPLILAALLACVPASAQPATQPTVNIGGRFPVASFFQPVRNHDLLKGIGVNVLCGPEVENSKALSPTDLAAAKAAWVKSAADRGLFVVLKSPAAPVPANCVGFLLDVDEPNGKGKTAADLRANFLALRALDPAKPIFLSLAGDKVTSANFAKPAELQLYKDYATVCDVFTVDMYSKNRSTKYPTTWTGEGVKKLADATGKPVWAWIEHNDQRLPVPTDGFTNREPTPDEIKATVDYAVQQGAKGIGWFSTCDSGKYGWPDSYFPFINRNGVNLAPQVAMVVQVGAALNPAPTTQPATLPTTPAPDPLTARLDAQDARIAALTARLDAMHAASAPATQASK